MALRHIHSIDMHNHKIAVIIPARPFNSAAFLPYLAHTQSVVDEARNLLTFKSRVLIQLRACEREESR